MALPPSNRFKRVGQYSNDQLLKDLRDFEEEVAAIALTPGEQGEKGEKGDQGPQGTPGIPGVKGDTGATGPTGPRGPQGDDGESGTDGEDGDNAVDRDDFGLIDVDYGLLTEEESEVVDDYGGVLSESLAQGAGDLTLYVQGDRGPRGLQGEQGIQGPQGIQGIQGIPGNDGVDGADGADGATGPAGPGLPAGGTAGQIVVKDSSADYDTSWSTVEDALPSRLKKLDTTAAADADNETEFGISWTNAATLNIPEASSGMLFTIPGNATGVNICAQYWYKFNSANSYRRRKNATTWSSWESVIETKDILETLFGSLGNPNTWTDVNTFNAQANFNGLIDVVNGQIRFPATQNPSSNVNTLDDYEEGTFIPRVDGLATAGTATYANALGKYTKVGDTCLFTLSLNYSAHTGTGAMAIEGLPFTCHASYNGSPAALDYSLFTYANPPFALVAANTTRILIRSAASNAAVVNIAVDAEAILRVSGNYTVA